MNDVPRMARRPGGTTHTNTTDNMHSFENLRLEVDGAVAVVTVDRPQVLNALNGATLAELKRAMSDLQHDDEIRAVVITGAGQKSFIAGADIRELALLSPAAGREHAAAGQRVLDLIEGLGRPVIAAINGYALGGGCELAMACTLRIAAEGARLGQPEINLGLIPGYGGTQRLARHVGAGRAFEMLLTGEPITAAEAHRIGLVNRVVPDADLLPEAKGLAAALASKAPLAVRYILDAVGRGANLPLSEAQALEAALFGLIASTADMKEGTSAFLEKRRPEFKGR
jgi:enoyl-CoA hydratase